MIPSLLFFLRVGSKRNLHHFKHKTTRRFHFYSMRILSNCKGIFYAASHITFSAKSAACATKIRFTFSFSSINMEIHIKQVFCTYPDIGEESFTII
ncbi:MAG: hypothetical protein IJ711_06970, partial [Lachnospiraceae bacterium]|nr:hypothetical protein [Lachnospiraceae bacterium]